MSSNEDTDREMERLLQTHFESEAEGLKAPAGLWERVEAQLRDNPGGRPAEPIWRRLVRPGRWGMSPAFSVMALLVLAISGAWLFTATPWQDDGDAALGLPQATRGPRVGAAFATPTPAPPQPGATPAPQPTAAPAATSAPTGAAGPPGAPGAGGATARSRDSYTFGSTDQGNVVSEQDGRAIANYSSPPWEPIQSSDPSASAGGRGQLETAQRQVISQGSLSIDVEDVPSATVQVRLIAEGVGGFVEQLSSQGVEERQQSTMTIRVPQPEFFNAFQRIQALGRVLNENAGSEDVTERFIDLEARLKSAGREEQSLLSLLDRTTRVSEILTIERELSRIRTELEQVQGQVNFLERRVNLATITIALFPPQFREGQPPSASLSLVVSNVSQRVAEAKALISAAGGELDQVLTSVQDGAARATLRGRVFVKDFESVVSAIEFRAKVIEKEIQESTSFSEAEQTAPISPESRITVSFVEEESSRVWPWVTAGAAASVVVLALLFYVTYQVGQRRGERE